MVFLESTAEGKEGHFYELCENAQAKQRMGTPLTPLDFKFHFFPWWEAPEYALDPAGVVIGEDHTQRYFEKLGATAGIALTPAQAGLVRQEVRDPARRHEAGISRQRRQEAFEAASRAPTTAN